MTKPKDWDDETKAVVLWGEPGTWYEEDTAEFIKEKGFTKPVIAYIGGLFVEALPEGTVFGHAASIIEGGRGKPSHKMKVLRDAGCFIPDSFNDMIPLVRRVMES